MQLPESARSIIDSNALAHLVTLNPDGRPQVTLIWVGLDGDDIVAAHLPENKKVRNIRRDALDHLKKAPPTLRRRTGQRSAPTFNRILI